MDDQSWLLKEFELYRSHLAGVAFRILGSRSEVDDALQEVWLKLSRADNSEVVNFGGWLTTIVSRVCIDPESDAVLADSIGPALAVVMETLTPAERVAYVLHDIFDLPFNEVASTLRRSPAAARQLASRARRRVRASPDASGTGREREIVDAFLAATREGQMERLPALLSPNAEIRVDGRIALAAFSEAELRIVFFFTVEQRTIVGVDMVADPSRLSTLEVIPLD